MFPLGIPHRRKARLTSQCLCLLGGPADWSFGANNLQICVQPISFPETLLNHILFQRALSHPSQLTQPLLTCCAALQGYPLAFSISIGSSPQQALAFVGVPHIASPRQSLHRSLVYLNRFERFLARLLSIHDTGHNKDLAFIHHGLDEVLKFVASVITAK